MLYEVITADGKPVVAPTQDMIMGVYYMTLIRPGAKGEGKIFASPDEAKMAYSLGDISIQAKIKVRIKREIKGETKSRIIETTVGRLIFNEPIPQDLGFVKRKTEDDMFKLEIDQVVGKKLLSPIVERCYFKHGNTATARMLDSIKSMGYKYSTKAAVTISVSDIVVPEDKPRLLREAEEQVQRIEDAYSDGLISEEERYDKVVMTWKETKDLVTESLLKNLDEFNSINMMSTSGARGNVSQIGQLAGMRGLMANPSGRISYNFV